jgi:DNA-directed RNA polymerase subunit RPC12/RpoP
MVLTCSQCNANLPQNAGLNYRFCPQCGARISAVIREIHENIQTIPPDLDPAVLSPHGQKDPADENEESNGPENQTQAPEITGDGKPVPEIKAPAGPRPSSFYRVTSTDQYSTSRAFEQRRTDNRRSVKMFWFLAMTVLIILAGGIYFTFWLLNI